MRRVAPTMSPQCQTLQHTMALELGKRLVRRYEIKNVGFA
jgi:hypothetical protein